MVRLMVDTTERLIPPVPATNANGSPLAVKPPPRRSKSAQEQETLT